MTPELSRVRQDQWDACEYEYSRLREKYLADGTDTATKKRIRRRMVDLLVSIEKLRREAAAR